MTHGLPSGSILIFLVIQILLAVTLSGIVALFFRQKKMAFAQIVIYSVVGIAIGYLFGLVLASTFTANHYIENAGKLLVIQIPTYLLIFGIIIGLILYLRKVKKHTST